MPRCDECRFFQAYPPAPKPDQMVFAADGIRGGGECRVNPPHVVEHEQVATFPIVWNATWCGRFEARESSNC